MKYTAGPEMLLGLLGSPGERLTEDPATIALETHAQKSMARRRIQRDYMAAS